MPIRLSPDSNANVHSGPDTSYDTVGSITAGSKYPVLGKDSDQDAWYEIRYDPTHSDCTGWIPAPQLSLKSTTTYNLNVRSGPGRHPRVSFIKGGSTTRYDILGKDAPTATWYQIRFGNTIGWVSADYVQTHGSLAGVPVAWVPGPQLSLKSTTTYNLNVRARPDATADRVGFIPGGSTERYDLLARNAATPTWYQIRFSDTVTGWVHGDYVQTHGSLTGLPVR